MAGAGNYPGKAAAFRHGEFEVGDMGKETPVGKGLLEENNEV